MGVGVAAAMAAAMAGGDDGMEDIRDTFGEGAW